MSVQGFRTVLKRTVLGNERHVGLCWQPGARLPRDAQKDSKHPQMVRDQDPGRAKDPESQEEILAKAEQRCSSGHAQCGTASGHAQCRMAEVHQLESIRVFVWFLKESFTL